MPLHPFPVHNDADMLISSLPFKEIVALYEPKIGTVEMAVAVSTLKSTVIGQARSLAGLVLGLVGIEGVAFVQQGMFRGLKDVVVKRSAVRAVRGRLNYGSPYTVFLNCGGGYVEMYLREPESAYSLAEQLSLWTS